MRYELNYKSHQVMAFSIHLNQPCRGIGRKIAIAFADARANVVLCARNKNEIENIDDFINGKDCNAN